jgi:hypothetical protein
MPRIARRRLLQGMPAEDAVKWAHGELVKIYA